MIFGYHQNKVNCFDVFFCNITFILSIIGINTQFIPKRQFVPNESKSAWLWVGILEQTLQDFCKNLKCCRCRSSVGRSIVTDAIKYRVRSWTGHIHSYFEYFWATSSQIPLHIRESCSTKTLSDSSKYFRPQDFIKVQDSCRIVPLAYSCKVQ